MSDSDRLLNIIKNRIAGHILASGDIEIAHLQAILAILLGESDPRVILSLMKGRETKFNIPKNVKGYIVKRAPERPSGDKKIGRDIQIAIDYEKLRQSVNSEDALSALSKESKSRYGTSLGIERVKSCVTRGRRFIKNK